MNGIFKRKRRHCKKFFIPDPRNRSRQKYCDKDPCRMASKAASQKKNGWISRKTGIISGDRIMSNVSRIGENKIPDTGSQNTILPYKIS